MESLITIIESQYSLIIEQGLSLFYTLLHKVVSMISVRAGLSQYGILVYILATALGTALGTIIERKSGRLISMAKKTPFVFLVQMKICYRESKRRQRWREIPRNMQDYKVRMSSHRIQQLRDSR